MKEKILKCYYLNKISFKCFPLLFKTQAYYTYSIFLIFSEISGVYSVDFLDDVDFDLKESIRYIDVSLSFKVSP